jgi:hypothetical protein
MLYKTGSGENLTNGQRQGDGPQLSPARVVLTSKFHEDNILPFFQDFLILFGRLYREVLYF